MTRMESQIRELFPSVKDALFRRLNFAEDLAWLRDEKRKDIVVGFEVDLEGQELSGFALIAIQRHTVVAFVSDRHESPKLILFPNLETLFDPGFELLDLIVTRKEFRDAKFIGVPTGHGRFGDMVKDMTPPNRRMDLPETVVAQMANIADSPVEQSAVADGKGTGPAQVTLQKPVVQESAPVVLQPAVMSHTEEPYEEGPPEGFYEDRADDFDGYQEPGYDEYDDYQEPGYDDYGYGQDVENTDEVTVTPPSRSDTLKQQSFSTLNEVIDFVVTKLGVNRPLAVTLANKAMQSKVSPQYRVQLAVNIFCKLMDEDKI